MANKRAAAHPKSGPRPTSPASSRSDNSNSSSKASSPSDTPGKNQIDFQFLNFSHPSEAKASPNRKAVRSHVTREQHRREHAAAAARKAHSSRDTESEAEGSASRQRSPITLHLPHRSPAMPTSAEISPATPTTSRSTSPLYSPATRINPADIYPEQWQPYLPRIIDHYLSHMAIDIPNLDGPGDRGLLRTRFFPFVLTDAAPLHSLMLMATAHYGQMRGSQSHTIDILQLKGMAIREINGALEDPQRMISDQLIAAVAKMASYEALFGDHHIFNTHMTGLLRMVSLRGGLPALGLDGLLERILLWIDSNVAHIKGTQVYFDRAAFPTSARHPTPDPQRFLGGLASLTPSPS